jgi:hypothetical protein
LSQPFVHNDGTKSALRKGRHLYVFLDEGGNLDFSAKGTRYFTVTSVTKERSFEMHGPLLELKYDLLEMGIDLEYFHASEDNKTVRAKVFSIIAANLKTLRVDSTIVDKKSVNPQLRADVQFYPKVVGQHLEHLTRDSGLSGFSEVLVITDQIPIANRRQAVVKGIKMALSKALPGETTYRVFHHDSKSNLNLQIADYCNWAFFRKWERGDLEHYQMLNPAIKSETPTTL